MTRPIYEPNPQRQGASLEFGQQQLYRRPAPTTQAGMEIKSIVCSSNAQQVIAGADFGNLIWQVNNNRNPECFTPIVFSGSDYYQIRILEDGVYTVACYVTISTAGAYGTADVDLDIYRSDLGQHRSKRWSYSSTTGYNDGTIDWTFEMDGTGGSNRRIEFQIINFHTAIAGTNDELNLNDLRIEVHKWPGTITL
jgi:hypothetical protein